MDRREAIRVIKELLADRDNDSRYPCVSSPRHYEALGLAIGALQEPITIRKVVLEPTNPETLLEQGMRSLDGLEAELFVKEKYQLSGETSTKLKNPDDSLLTEDSEACKEQKSKLEETPTTSKTESVEGVAESATTTDCISRADTVNALCRECQLETKCGGADCHENWCTEVAVVMGMPPVEPKRPRGKWITAETVDILDGKSTVNVYQCNQCGGVEWINTDFCPNCGADMRGNSDEK